MAQQTAIEWLHQIFKEREPDKFDWEQAKQMEKKQIMNAWVHGFADVYNWPINGKSEQYYNETYGK